MASSSRKMLIATIGTVQEDIIVRAPSSDTRVCVSPFCFPFAFISLLFKYFRNFIQLTAVESFYMDVMKSWQAMGWESSQMLSGQKILKLGNVILMK